MNLFESSFAAYSTKLVYVLPIECMAFVRMKMVVLSQILTLPTKKIHQILCSLTPSRKAFILCASNQTPQVFASDAEHVCYVLRSRIEKCTRCRCTNWGTSYRRESEDDTSYRVSWTEYAGVFCLFVCFWETAE